MSFRFISLRLHSLDLVPISSPGDLRIPNLVLRFHFPAFTIQYTGFVIKHFLVVIMQWFSTFNEWACWLADFCPPIWLSIGFAGLPLVIMLYCLLLVFLLEGRFIVSTSWYCSIKGPRHLVEFCLTSHSYFLLGTEKLMTKMLLALS